MAPRYKSASPALNDKLQHYREDPEARAELNRRARQAQAERAAAVGPPAAASAVSPWAHLAQAAAGALAGQRRSTAPDTTALSPATAVGSQAVAKLPTPRKNFIEANAAVISPWPCTGPLSAQTLAVVQQQPALCPAGEHDRSRCSTNTSPTSVQQQHTPVAAARPSTAPTEQHNRTTAGNSGEQLAGTQQTKHIIRLNLTAIHSETCSSSSNHTKQQPQPRAADSSLPTARAPASSSKLGHHSSNSKSRPSSSCSNRSPSTVALWGPADSAGSRSCVELLAVHMAAKKEVAAARATEAAERRTALAAAEQQRRHEWATRGQSRETERLAAQQAEQEQALMQERQQVWGSVAAAAALIAALADQLKQLKQRGAAAAVIAAGYRRHLMLKRARKLAELVVHMKRLLKPYVERQRRATHARCAVRLLSFLQFKSSNSMILVAVQRLRRSVVYIQRYWRRVRLIRTAQEALLVRAMRDLEQHLSQRNRVAVAAAAASAAAAAQACGSSGRSGSGARLQSVSGAGHRGLPNGSGNGSGSRQDNSRQLQGGSAATASHSRSDHSHGSPPGAGPAAAGMHLGGPLLRPHDFFLDEAAPGPTSVHGGNSKAGGGTEISPEAAALPHGPMPPRGVQITGEVTIRRPASPAALQAGDTCSATTGASNRSKSFNSRQQHGPAGVQGSSGSSKSRPGSASPTRQQNTSRPWRSNQAGGSSNGCGGQTVGFHDDHVVDLELEARLKDLLDPLPNDVRNRVVRAHLAGVRRQLIAAREQHAAAMGRYREKLKLEELKVQLLKQAGVDASITLEAPVAPRMRVLVSKSKLKALIVEGMDLQLKQYIEARLAADDASGAAVAAACHTSASGGKWNS